MKVTSKRRERDGENHQLKTSNEIQIGNQAENSNIQTHNARISTDEARQNSNEIKERSRKKRSISATSI